MQDTFIRPARRIALTYFIVASLWILLSDFWLASFFENIRPAQTLKGSLFVLFTSVLLYFLMVRILTRIKGVAFKDPLCGLPNRLAFNSELESRCEASGRPRFSLTILDIDRFSDINDEQGHGRGDALLIVLAHRLTKQLGKAWYVARLSGDEFGILSPMNADPTATVKQLDELRLNLTQGSNNALLNEQKISAGTSHFPAHGTSSEELLGRADMALSYGKANGRNQHNVYHERLQKKLLERISLLKDLRLACETKAFSVVYQPLWSVGKRCWAGAEVLVRWHHPEKGAIAPDVFIPLAEKEGLIDTITEFVVDQAMAELDANEIFRDRLPYLAINLSLPVLLNYSTMNRLFSLIRRRGDTCPWIMMELTETAAMEDLDATLAAMRRWRRDGFEFSIDDFGTGYSSLARLRQMPIAELKIDRSFIQDVPKDQNDTVITKAILGLAQTLSLDIVGEGVETQEQADFLIEHGCTTLQGYLFARPVPIADLVNLISKPPEALTH